jgi:nitric oxide synthase-interacting protein
MTRKSKQAGGHKPLTYYERNKKFASYGTKTVRISTESQLPFGHCALSISEAVEPVATPSGHLYSREAILSYLLSQTVHIRQANEKLQNQKGISLKGESEEDEEESNKKKHALLLLEDAQSVSNKRARTKVKESLKDNALARTSYWLAEFQPEHKPSSEPAIPDRPLSPSSGNPLRRKDLRDLILKRDDQSRAVVCALSDKIISTQPVVALPGGHVILKDCYEGLVRPSMIDPFTSKKIKEKHVLELQKGRSGFSSSGTVEGKTYRPTIT